MTPEPLTPSPERLIQKLTTKIEHFTSDLINIDELSRQICERIKQQTGFDFVAVQLIDYEEQVIQTVYGTGFRGEWYNIAKHSLEADEGFQDIQVDIALARPPRLEIIAGWDPRFDEFIFNKFGHKHYVRAFVPLIIARDSTGYLIEAHPEQFGFEQKRTDQSRVIDLSPKESLAHIAQPFEIIGTIEAGFDNSDNRQERLISDDIAQAVFSHACRAAIHLYRATLLHVLELATDSIKQITRADCVNLHFPLGTDRPRSTYTVWLGPAFARELKPRKGGLGEQAIKDKKPIFLPERGTSDTHSLREANPAVYAAGIRAYAAFPLIFSNRQPSLNAASPGLAPDVQLKGVLYIGFTRLRHLTDEEVSSLQLFVALAKGAIRHATYHAQALHSRRQLANLHAIAKLLAGEINAQYMMHSIAGHALNILAADIVIIYAYESAQRRFLSDPAITGRRKNPNIGPGVPDGSYTPPLQLIDQEESIYADCPEQIVSLYGGEEQRAVAIQFVEEEGVKTAAAVLLRLGTEVVGVMFVNYRHIHSFSKYERNFIETLASTAAIAIWNRRLIRARQDSILIMTHQLRNPLSATKMKASALGVRLRRSGMLATQDGVYVADEVDRIVNQLDILDVMCEGIFTSLSQEAGQAVGTFGDDYENRIDVRNEIERLWTFAQSACGKFNQRLRSSTGGFDGKTIRISRRVFTNVVYSLFQNAVRYADENSEVEIEWRDALAEPIFFKVRSRGQPISPEETEMVFEKFTRARAGLRGPKGAGIGLWVARQLMRSAQGKIWLELDPNDPRVSTFVVQFPT